MCRDNGVTLNLYLQLVFHFLTIKLPSQPRRDFGAWQLDITELGRLANNCSCSSSIERWPASSLWAPAGDLRPRTKVLTIPIEHQVSIGSLFTTGT